MKLTKKLFFITVLSRNRMAEFSVENNVHTETSVYNVPAETSIHNDVPSKTNIHDDIPSETPIHDILQMEAATDSLNTDVLIPVKTITDNDGLQTAKDTLNTDNDFVTTKNNIDDDDGFQMAKDPLNSIDNLALIEVSNLSNTDVSNVLTLQHEQESLSTEVDDSSVKINSICEWNIEDYKIGDIIWAKLGKYPYWPSVVCADPDSKIYIKGTNLCVHTFLL